MNIEQMLAVLNPEIVERLKTAVEIGKWPNGIALSKVQRETCMQAEYAWDMKHLPEEKRGTKEEGEECDDDHHKHEPEFKPIRFV